MKNSGAISKLEMTFLDEAYYRICGNFYQFRNGGPYEFSVFEKSELLARRGSDCDSPGLDIQLIND